MDSAAEAVTKIAPADDAGSPTFDRFHWQACMAAADGLSMYLDSLTSAGEVRAGPDRSILCERHEDWIMISAPHAELVSAKHRDPEAGSWTTINDLVDAGGLAHLFGRWAALQRLVHARLVTNAAPAAGETRRLTNAIAALRGADSTDSPAGVDDAILRFAKALSKYGKGLPAPWQVPDDATAANSETDREQVADARAFLSVLDIDYRRPSRDLVGDAAPRRFARPVLDRLGCPNLDPDEIWTAVLELFVVAMRSRKPIPPGSLPIVLTSVLDGEGTPESIRATRDLERHTVALTDVDAAVRAAIARSSTPYEAAVDHALDVRLDSIPAMSSGWFHAFSRQDVSAAAHLAARSILPRDQEQMDALFSEQLALGAYALTSFASPATVVLACQNRAGHEVVIRDITISGKTDGPIIDRIVFFIESGGWNEYPITFFLDSGYPRAHMVEDGTDLGSYFEKRSIRIAAGQQAIVPIMFHATRASHSFTLRIKYDVDGRQVTCAIDNRGQPFRISPMIMHGGEPVDELPAAERDHLRSLTYLDTYLMCHGQDQLILKKCAPNEFPGYWRF